MYSLPDNAIFGGADGVLPRLVKDSDAPVLAAYVADSDYGQLEPWPIRAIRSAMLTPERAARVFPVCRRT